jgi:hypothetical protein
LREGYLLGSYRIATAPEPNSSHYHHPYTLAATRDRVTEHLEGEAAFAVIDRIAHKYTGQQYPLRTD